MLIIYLSFMLLSIVCFLLPGLYWLQKTKVNLSVWGKLVSSTILGYITFTLLSYISLVINIPFLFLPIIFVLALLSLRQNHHLLRDLKFPNPLKTISLISLLIVGVAGQLAVIAPSASMTPEGDLIFWSSHGHDGTWHLALMEELKKGYPLQNPVFAGEKLINYHFFSDIAPSDFAYYFRLPPTDLYFRFFPALFSIILGATAFLIGRNMGDSFYAGLFSTAFTYFAGSFGYIVTYLQSKTIAGESLFWASQIQSSAGNPPQIVSFTILLTFFYLFTKIENKKNNLLLFVCALLAGTLLVFKVYAGVVILLGLACVGGWQLIREKKIQYLKLFIFSLLLSLALYLPNTSQSSSFLIWEPGWYTRTLMIVPDKLNLLEFELRKQTYQAEHNTKRVIQLEITAFLIFLFGNLGMRFLGFWDLTKIARSSFANYHHLLFTTTLLISIILPMLFLQKGVASNSIQFLQYFLLLFGILAGVTTISLINKIKITILKISVVLLIFILAIPTQAGLIYNFYSHPPLATIEAQELQALDFLKKNSDENSIVLTSPYNKYLKLELVTPPIWAWFDTSYVAAFSSRRTFFSDSEQVDIMGYNLKDRAKIQQLIFEEVDPDNFTKLITQNNINYVYFPKLVRPKVDLIKTSLKQKYANDKVEIWSLN